MKEERVWCMQVRGKGLLSFACLNDRIDAFVCLLFELVYLHAKSD